VVANTLETASQPGSAGLADNVRRWATGELLVGPLDPAAGY
jgi:hypothetical protein